MTRFSMEAGESPAKVRFLNTGDAPIFNVRMHKIKGSWKQYPCTAEDPRFDGKCVFCHTYENSEKGTDGAELRPSELFVPELIDFRFLHTVEVPAPKAKSGKKLVLVPCEFQSKEIPAKSRLRCKHCESDDPEVAKRHFGGKKRWEMSGSRFELVLSADDDLGREVLLFPEEGADPEPLQLITIGWRCDGCKEEVISDEEVQDMTREELIDVSVTVHKCDECGHEDLLEQVWIGYRESNGEPEEFSMDDDRIYRMSIYDKNVDIKCAGERQNDGQVFRKFSVDCSRHSASSVQDDLEAMGFTEEEIADMLKPSDLPFIFRPAYSVKPGDFEGKDEEYVEAVLDYQATELKVENPYHQVARTSRARPFVTRKTAANAK